MKVLRAIHAFALMLWIWSPTAQWTQAAPSELSSREPRAATSETVSDVAAKIRRYAERLFQRYDRNKDGLLAPEEWSRMHGQPELADLDRDKKITLAEWTRFVADFGKNRRIGEGNWSDRVENSAVVRAQKTGVGDAPATPSPSSSAKSESLPLFSTGRQPESPSRPATFHVPKSRLPAGLPDWFVKRDLNGDGQLSLAEYAPNATPADIEQFARYDRNGDGLITVKECLPGGATSGRRKPGRDGKTPIKTGAN